MAPRRCSRRAISAGTSNPSLTGRLSLSSASFSSCCTSSRSWASIRLACSQDSALCLLALAAILVPSSAMLPSFRHFISRASTSTCTNSALDLRQEAPAEGGDAVVVGLRVGGNEAKRHRVVTGPLDLAAGVHPAGVAVHQQAQQHRRVVRIAAASGVLPNQLAQVQLVDDFDDKARQVILRQPFVHRRRQQVRGVSIYGNEAAHAVGVRCNCRNCPSCRPLGVAGKARQAPSLTVLEV